METLGRREDRPLGALEGREWQVASAGGPPTALQPSCAPLLLIEEHRLHSRSIHRCASQDNGKIHQFVYN